MDKKTRNKILWIIVAVILILAFLLWVLRTSDTFIPRNNNTNTEQPVFTPPSVDIEYQQPETVEESPTEFSALNLAKTYAARFGSWSTDNQGANINELLPLSTNSMQTYLRGIELDYDAEEFSGITTKSISASLVDIDDDSAEVLVNTQKIKTTANLEKEVYYEDAEVNMVRSNNRWLVNSFNWQ